MHNTNWEKSIFILNKKGIGTHEVPDSIIEYLLNDIKKESSFIMSNQLAGHLQEQYFYKDWPEFIETYFTSISKKDTTLLTYERKFSSFQDIHKTIDFKLLDLWCNFQKKNEFNPIHSHQGLFSFIVFLKIPYDLHQEDLCYPHTTYKEDNAVVSATSKLCFLFHDMYGEIKPLTLNVDKSFENKMLIFPAKTPHLVYPFYTSEEYRITVSGNIVYKNATTR